MTRPMLALTYAALIPALALGGSAIRHAGDPGPRMGTPFVTVSAVDTRMGCKVTVSASNLGTLRAAISRESQVRAKVGLVWGTWKDLKESIWINPQSSRSWTYSLDFGCNTPRRYRFLVKQFDDRDRVTKEAWVNVPRNGDQSTTSTQLGLGALFGGGFVGGN